MRWRVAGCVMAAFSYAACGSDEPTAAPILPLISDTPGETANAFPGPCSEVFAPGVTIGTEDDLDDGCMQGGTLYFPGPSIHECSDGRSLMWNEFGWGYIEGPFRTHAPGAEKVAPEADRKACPV